MFRMRTPIRETEHRRRLGPVRLAVCIGLFALALVPAGQARDRCGSPTTWREYMQDVTEVSTHVVFGTVSAVTPVQRDPARNPILRCELAVSRLFRGQLESPDSFIFWRSERRDNPLAVGETCLVFATVDAPGLTIAPAGQAEVFFLVKAAGDSIKPCLLPRVSVAAFLDTLGEVVARTPLNKNLLGLR